MDNSSSEKAQLSRNNGADGANVKTLIFAADAVASQRSTRWDSRDPRALHFTKGNYLLCRFDSFLKCHGDPRPSRPDTDVVSPGPRPLIRRTFHKVRFETYLGRRPLAIPRTLGWIFIKSRDNRCKYVSCLLRILEKGTIIYINGPWPTHDSPSVAGLVSHQIHILDYQKKNCMIRNSYILVTVIQYVSLTMFQTTVLQLDIFNCTFLHNH